MELHDLGLIDSDVDVRVLLPRQFGLSWNASLDEVKRVFDEGVVFEGDNQLIAKMYVGKSYQARLSFGLSEQHLSVIDLNVFVRTFSLEEEWSSDFAILRKGIVGVAEGIFDRLVYHMSAKLGSSGRLGYLGQSDRTYSVIRRYCWAIEDSILCAELDDGGPDHPVLVRLRFAPIDAT